MAAPDSSGPSMSRRSFLSWATGLLAVIGGVVVGIPLIGELAAPAGAAGKEGFVEVGNVGDLEIGVPKDLGFVDPTQDLFIRENVPRSVWAVKSSDAEEGGVVVYSSACTHLGCKYDWDAAAGRFVCPCHGSTFNLEGKVLGGPAPRPLDTLPSKVGKDGALLVQWVQYKEGTDQKTEI
jgi:menaquinol-cytochrome c reductase iron-sulfur subunit